MRSSGGRHQKEAIRSREAKFVSAAPAVEKPLGEKDHEFLLALAFRKA
jgi:hypothetical protein